MHAVGQCRTLEKDALPATIPLKCPADLRASNPRHLGRAPVSRLPLRYIIIRGGPCIGSSSTSSVLFDPDEAGGLVERTRAGSYTTRRNGGIVSQYEVAWAYSAQGILLWHATVRCDGKLAGSPNGKILDTRGADVPAFVKGDRGVDRKAKRRSVTRQERSAPRVASTFLAGCGNR